MNRRDLEIVAQAVAAAFLTEHQAEEFEKTLAGNVPNFDVKKFRQAVAKHQVDMCNRIGQEEKES